jgi:ribosomal protein S18 acetylase RimI-like enzyme
MQQEAVMHAFTHNGDRKYMNVDISAALDRLRIADIHSMLSRAWWSPGITTGEISKGIHNSALVVGAYVVDQGQVGFLRVVSDKVRFAYIMDVVVAEEFRRKGIGQGMVRFAMAHPELRDVYQWLLITKDAHGVYEKCGFRKLQAPELWMTIIGPRPDRRSFEG